MADTEGPANEKLLAFAREVVRQRSVLEYAIARDDIVTQLMRQDRDGRGNRIPGAGHRRKWTRKVQRYFEASDNGDIPLLRTERLLLRIAPSANECSYRPLLTEAIQEAKQADRFALLIDQLTTLGAAHFGFLTYVIEAVKKIDFSTQPVDVNRFYDNALRQLAAVAPEVMNLLRPLLLSESEEDSDA